MLLAILAGVAALGTALLVVLTGSHARARVVLVALVGLVAGASLMSAVSGPPGFISTSNRVTFMEATVDQVNASGTSLCLLPTGSDDRDDQVCADVPDAFRGELTVGTDAVVGLADVRPPEGVADAGSRMVVHVTNR